jgi:hypothetical protein
VGFEQKAREGICKKKADSPDFEAKALLGFQSATGFHPARLGMFQHGGPAHTKQHGDVGLFN